jgi:hypothetical protein
MVAAESASRSPRTLEQTTAFDRVAAGSETDHTDIWRMGQWTRSHFRSSGPDAGKHYGVREDLQYFWDNKLRAIGVIIIV